MKTKTKKILGFLSMAGLCLGALLTAACFGGFSQPNNSGNDPVPAGTGKVVLNIGGSGPRTALPTGINTLTYTVICSADDKDDVPVTLYSGNGYVVLGAGVEWTISIEARNTGTLVGTASLKVTLVDGEIKTFPQILLQPVTGGAVGDGTLTYTVNFPVDYEEATLTWYDDAGDEIDAVDLIQDGNTGSIDLAPGSYLFRAVVENAQGRRGGRSESVHIYTEMTTALNWTITPDLEDLPVSVTLTHSEKVVISSIKLQPDNITGVKGQNDVYTFIIPDNDPYAELVEDLYLEITTANSTLSTEVDDYVIPSYYNEAEDYSLTLDPVGIYALTLDPTSGSLSVVVDSISSPSVTAESQIDLFDGKTVSITAVVGSQPFENFTVDGITVGDLEANPLPFTMPQNDVTVTANFVIAPVSNFDLTSLLTKPVHQEIPQTTITDTQYTGAVEWSYSDDNSAVGTRFKSGKPVKAVATLTAKPGYSFDSLGVNAFSHSDATAVSNTAGVTTVTLTFSAPVLEPYLNLSPTGSYNVTIKACCWANDAAGRTPEKIINGVPSATPANNNYWDYGWNGSYGTANGTNGSSWPDILASGTFNGDACGQGHRTVLVNGAVASQLGRLARGAHVFTIDLGEVVDNISSFEMYPRDATGSGGGDNWPQRFEIFYSNNDIDLVFNPDGATGTGITSLGIVQGADASGNPIANGEWPAAKPSTWANLDLTTKTANSQPFSARYIQLRIYAESKNRQDDTWWIQPSISQIRIGVSE